MIGTHTHTPPKCTHARRPVSLSARNHVIFRWSTRASSGRRHGILAAAGRHGRPTAGVGVMHALTDPIQCFPQVLMRAAALYLAFRQGMEWNHILYYAAHITSSLQLHVLYEVRRIRANKTKLRTCLVHSENQKVFKVLRHIESCGTCMKY